MTDTSRTLERETEAARVLLEQIREVCGDDETLIADTIEGETSLFELIAKVDAAELDDQAAVIGLDAMIDKLDARKRRIKAAIETKRTLIANALSVVGKKSHKTALGSISISKSAPIAIVTDESQIPARFWTPQPPKLDKAALNAAVKAGEDIPGAVQSNGGIKLSILR